MQRVQSVFDANYASVTLNDNTQAAAFQVALWNALYDGDEAADEGVFRLSVALRQEASLQRQTPI